MNNKILKSIEKPDIQILKILQYLTIKYFDYFIFKILKTSCSVVY